MPRAVASTICVFISILTLVGCSYYSNGEFGPQDQRDFAKHFVELFAARDTAAIDKQIDPDLRDKLNPDLDRMFKIYPKGTPTRVQTYNYAVKTDSSGTIYFLNILYEFPTANDMTAEVALAHAGTSYFVKGIHIHIFPAAALAANNFSLKQSPAGGYLFLASMVAVVGLSIYALFSCVVTKGIRHKWLWIVFILVGFGKLSLNWATGQLSFALLYFLLFSAGGFRIGSGPWILSLSLPLGALLFLMKHHSFVRAGGQASPPPDGS